MVAEGPTGRRVGVALVFAVNGFLFATLLSRIPALRDRLDLNNSQLGWLLLALAVGAVSALAASGVIIGRTGPGAAVRGAALACSAGLVLSSGACFGLGSPVLTAVGLFVFGIGNGLWDVAMNVEAADVERALGRTIMPRFHAGWSLGSVGGAGLGVLASASSLPVPVHLGVLALSTPVVAVVHAGGFIVRPAPPALSGPRAASAWTEPKTLAIGVMVLIFALAEGTANDWLSVALIDGYATPAWVGVAGFACFTTSMTAGRLIGPLVLDRLGRRATLWGSAGLVAAGVVVTVTGQTAFVVALGVLAWGLGASLGFPVGMSAAAEDPGRSAARVGVVSTIGYGAFLAGPPLLGSLGDLVGTLPSLLVVAVLMVPAALVVTFVGSRDAVPQRPG